MFIQAKLTLDGTVQTLSEATIGSGLDDLASYPCRAILLQPSALNANPVYVGDANVASDAYAFRLEAASSGVPPAPFVLGEFESGPLKLGSFSVLGTNTEILYVGIVVY